MPKFLVPAWWYELHEGRLLIEANDLQDARRQAMTLPLCLDKLVEKDPSETWCDYGDHGVDDGIREVVDHDEAE